MAAACAGLTLTVGGGSHGGRVGAAVVSNAAD